MHYIKFPQAKNWIEIESIDDLFGYSRIFQIAYEHELKVEECEFDGFSEMEIEIVSKILTNKKILEEPDYTLPLSLPGTDKFFNADDDDISYANMLLAVCYGVEMTPENTQLDISSLEPEFKEVFNEYAPCVKKEAGMWKRFIWSFWVLCWNVEVLGRTIEEYVDKFQYLMD